MSQEEDAASKKEGAGEPRGGYLKLEGGGISSPALDTLRTASEIPFLTWEAWLAEISKTIVRVQRISRARDTLQVPVSITVLKPER